MSATDGEREGRQPQEMPEDDFCRSAGYRSPKTVEAETAEERRKATSRRSFSGFLEDLLQDTTTFAAGALVGLLTLIALVFLA